MEKSQDAKDSQIDLLKKKKKIDFLNLMNFINYYNLMEFKYFNNFYVNIVLIYEP